MSLIEEVRVAIGLWKSGEFAETEGLFARLWEDRRFAEDALARCFLAHSMVDIQADPRDELRWDLLALEAAREVTEEQAEERNVPGGRFGLYPSLHLNVADAYMRLGDDPAAREHYHPGRRHLDLLGADEYGARLRRGFAKYERVYGLDCD